MSSLYLAVVYYIVISNVCFIFFFFWDMKDLLQIQYSSKQSLSEYRFRVQLGKKQRLRADVTAHIVIQESNILLHTELLHCWKIFSWINLSCRRFAHRNQCDTVKLHMWGLTTFYSLTRHHLNNWCCWETPHDPIEVIM